MLPELDQLYQVDVAGRRARGRAVQGEREEFDVAMSCETSGLITEDEAKSLRKVFEDKKKNELLKMAD
eukprot:8474049-Pyramimonas_sp.AAC.1